MSALTAALEAAHTPNTGRFFDALIGADARVHQTERAEWAATFAPPIRSYASCSCGRTFECRDDQINVTTEEKAAAAEAVADMFGRGPLDDLDARIVARVIDAMNHQRASDDSDAMRDFYDAHADCGDDR